MKKKILLGLIGVFVVIQFFQIDKTNPPIDPAKDFLTITNADPATSALIKDACYDCHSNETEYPWYTYIAPLNYWIKNHIDEGRSHLNLSVWGDYSAKKQHHKLEETIEMLEDNKMPLKSFTYTHPEARITEAQFNHLKDYTMQCMQKLNL